MVAELVNPRGYFSVLRYRPDATRDEARNVAVLLVSREGEFGGMKAGPVSAVSPRLHEQGLVDAVLVALESRFTDPRRPNLDALAVLQRELSRSLVLTEPKPVLVPDVETTLQALYRAYVKPLGGGAAQATKGAVLDKVVNQLRREGRKVRRGHYIGPFLFDVVFEDEPRVTEVLSFATHRRRWDEVENDAAHFLYGLQHVSVEGSAIVKAPDEAEAAPAARESYDRVIDWFRSDRIPVQDASDVIPDGRGRSTEAQQTIAW